MTNHPNQRSRFGREILFACGRSGDTGALLRGTGVLLGADGYACCRAHDCPEAVRRVERGGLAGAVVCADASSIPGLSVVRIIRSIDADLPCWLVMSRATRQSLEEALALRVAGVLTHPVSVVELVRAMRRVLGAHTVDN